MRVIYKQCYNVLETTSRTKKCVLNRSVGNTATTLRTYSKSAVRVAEFNVFRNNAVQRVRAKDVENLFLDFAELLKIHPVIKDTGLWNQMIKASFLQGDVNKSMSYYKQLLENGAIPDIVTYDSLIAVCAKNNLPEKVEWVFGEMQKRSIEPTSRTYGIVLGHYVKNGLFEHAIRLYDNIKPNALNDEHTGAMMKVYLHQSNLEKILELYQRTGNMITGTIVMQMYDKLDDVDGAKNIHDDLKRRYGKVDDVCSLVMLNVYGKRGLVSEAEELFETLCHYDPACSIMLQMYCKSDSIQRVIRFVTDMRARGWNLNLECYTIIISLCKDAHRLDDAMFFFQELKRKNLTPDSVLYLSLLSMFVQHGHIHEAQEIFNEMKENGIVMDVEVCNSVLELYGKKGDREDIMKLFREMKVMKIAPDVMTYNILMTIAKKKGHYEDVFFWFKELKVARLIPDGISYGILVDTYSTLKDYAKVDQILKEMKEINLKPSIPIYTMLMKNAAVKNKLSEMQDIFRQMKFNLLKPDSIAYHLIIQQYLESSRASLAQKLFSEMKYLNVRPLEETYNILIKGTEIGYNVGNKEDLIREKERNYPKMDLRMMTEPLE